MSTAAIIGGTAAAGLASSAIGAHAAGKAADAQVSAANNAAALERQSATEALNFNKLQYGNSLNLLSPYYNTGTAANSRLAYLMGLSPHSGLPPGVINPNAPAPTTNTGRVGAGGFFGGGTGPNGTQGDAVLPLNGGGARTANRFSSLAASPGADGFGPARRFAADPNDPSVTFNPGGTGGLGPPQFAGDPNDPSATGTRVNGSPEQVPRTDGGGDPGNPTAADPGGFGSLAQGWNQTFKSPTSLTDDPGYKFRLDQGNKALENSAAARGGLFSGGTAKALDDYNQGSASQEYQNTYNRSLQNYNTNYNTFTNDQTNTFNRLMALFNGGQVSANQLSASGITSANNAANIGLTSAANIGQQLNNAGAATASGYVGRANAINGAINGGTNNLLQLLLAQQGGG